MGLDWCVGVYKNEADFRKGNNINPEDLPSEIKTILHVQKWGDDEMGGTCIPPYRGKCVQYLFSCCLGHEVAELAFGTDHKFDDDTEAPFLTDGGVDVIITVLKKIKEMDDVEEEAYEDDWESWEEICEECDNAIDWLEKIQKVNTMGVICKVHCWY